MILKKKCLEWKEWENRLSALLQGKVVYRSGAGQIHKADVRTEEFLVEAKYTTATTYSFKSIEWNKIKREALNVELIPLFAIKTNKYELGVMRVVDYAEILPLDFTPCIEKKNSFAVGGTVHSAAVTFKHDGIEEELIVFPLSRLVKD